MEIVKGIEQNEFEEKKMKVKYKMNGLLKDVMEDI